MAHVNKEPIEKLRELQFNYLTIIDDAGRDKNGRMVVARCVCGVVKTYYLGVIKYGRTKSCGCYNKKRMKESKTTHGLSEHPLYSIWQGMIKRCFKSTERCYKDYGGRGIIVCSEWVDDFVPFYDWSISNGYSKGLQIDRRDNDGNYEPENCRWVKRKVNARNKRTNVFVSFKDETKTIAEWCEIYGLSQKRFNARMKRGWSLERTLLSPLIFGRDKKSLAWK